MNDATIRQKLFEISETMKDVSIETAKIAGLQSDLCVVKEESKGLVRKVEQLESEVVEFNKQMTDLKSKNGVLSNLNKTISERLSKVEKTLASQSPSAFVGQSDECVVGVDKVLDCCPNQDSIAPQVTVSDEAGPSTVSGGETSGKGSATTVKKPKAQRKREQEQLHINFSKTMAGKKIPEKLWASGFLKMSVDQWEGSSGYMQPEQLCNFVEKNIGKLVSFASTAESKERLILTLLKICGDRAVPMEKLKEILHCFVKRGTISEDDVVRFVSMYKI